MKNTKNSLLILGVIFIIFGYFLSGYLRTDLYEAIGASAGLAAVPLFNSYLVAKYFLKEGFKYNIFIMFFTGFVSLLLNSFAIFLIIIIAMGINKIFQNKKH